MALLLSGVAYGQAQIVPSDRVKGAESKDVEGWNPFLGLTSTLNMVSNSHVVGQVDGFSTLFGLGATGGADFIKGKHLFRSSLTLNESVARTPVIDEFLKTNDILKLEGLYNYFLLEKMGLYGRLDFTTSLFATDDVRAETTTWGVKNGMAVDPLLTGERLRLSDPFQPFTINESAGVFVDPIQKDKLTVSLRAGIGGRHTFAEGVLVDADEDATADIVEMSELSNVHQLGAELFGGAQGKFNEGKASYRAGLSILFPFVNNDDADRSVGKLTRVAFEGNVQFNMYSWMSLAYTATVTRDAQLFKPGEEQLQVQNTLLLTFQFSVVKKAEKPKAPTKEELELEAAKKRADEAEQRATDAEQRLQRLGLPQEPAQDGGAAPAPTPAPAPAPDASAPAPAPAPAPPKPQSTLFPPGSGL